MFSINNLNFVGHMRKFKKKPKERIFFISLHIADINHNEKQLKNLCNV